MCVHKKQPKYGVVRGGNVTVRCEVSANPPVHRFKWWFSSAGKSMQVKNHDLATSEGNTNAIRYS